MRTTPRGRPQPDADGGRERVNKKTALRFAGGYGLSVAISGVVSLAVIPAIIVAAGADAWATIAVAQAVAGLRVRLRGLRVGCREAHRGRQLTDDRRGAYSSTRCSAERGSVSCHPVSIVIAILVIGHDDLLAALTVTSGMLVALGPGWFFVGESSPIRFLLIDTVPASRERSPAPSCSSRPATSSRSLRCNSPASSHPQ